ARAGGQGRGRVGRTARDPDPGRRRRGGTFRDSDGESHVTPSEPLVRWDWIGGHLDEIGARLVEHLALTGLAVGVGLLVALGLGFAPRQLLWRVELPLALPVIMAGLRAATVSTIGLVTVTALIGLGGFGYFILQGIQRFFTTPLIVGAILSVALAVAADTALV